MFNKFKNWFLSNLLIVLLFVMPVVTYGYAANQFMKRDYMDTGSAGFVAIFAAVGWPLYWSWEIWDRVDD